MVLNTTKGNDLRDGGKAENENKPKLSIWLFLCKGKLTHSARFKTSDMGLRWRGKVNVKSGSPHAELQLPLSYMHSLLCKGSIRRRVGAGVPVHLATVPGYPAAVDLEYAGNRIQNNKNSRFALCRQYFTTPNIEETNKQLEKVTTSSRETLPILRPSHHRRKPRTNHKAKSK